MAEGAGAAVDVDLVVRQLVLLHGGHGDHGKGLVDFIQVDLARAPAGFFEHFADRAHGRCGKQRRLLRMSTVSCDYREWGQAQFFSGGAAHHDEGRGAVGYGRSVGGRYRTVLAKSRFERGNFVELGIEGRLVLFHQALVLAGLDGNGRRFPGKAAFVIGFLCAFERGDGEPILGFAGEAETVGAFFGEAAHQSAAAFFVTDVGVLQAVVEHVVDDLAVTHAIAAARLGQQVGGVTHRFHAAGNHDVVAARGEQIVREHRRLHARSAHFVDGGAAG